LRDSHKNASVEGLNSLHITVNKWVTSLRELHFVLSLVLRMLGSFCPLKGRLMRRLTLIVASALIVAALLLSVGARNASAENIFIGSPTCGAPPGCPVFGNEVNGITGNTFTLDQATGTSSTAMTNPVLLMIGVPNVGGTFSAPTITLSAGTGILGGIPPTGLIWNPTTGFASTMTSGGPITDAYQALGLTDPFSGSGNSENFGNWAAADSAVLGLTAANFGVYVYELNNTGLLGHPSSVNVTFNDGGLPFGTFVVAYGCATSTWPATACGSGDIYATPFTQAGLEVPEPSSISLLFTGLIGLLGLGAVSRRRLLTT
jgi:hypothetical protein